jgi:N-acetyl-1-D-myo-inositol-2-amino-2-deoxy-alpha-D-glucopyranoside deacetylase
VARPSVVPMDPQRLLLVHAHPDDESINNGATMARYVAEGHGVTLVTCTLGEEGEILVPELAHIAADKEDGLGQHRIGELAEAMKALGVTDHRFLGGPGRYRDSGMEWDETGHARAMSTVRDDTFWKADLTEAATLMAEIIRELRPAVIVTYDEFGNYGHPDHVQAHRVTMRAAELADVPRVFWVVREDQSPTVRVDGTAFLTAKVAAMRAHATQLALDAAGTAFSLSNGEANPISGVEWYRQVAGPPSPPDDLLG